MKIRMKIVFTKSRPHQRKNRILDRKKKHKKKLQVCY